MPATDRIHSLLARHATLEEKLDNESGRPLPDDVAIHDLKRQKLAIKDEIERLQRH
jgi:hypothetical protein